MGAKYAHKVIHETHTFWCDLVQKQLGDDFGFQLPKLEAARAANQRLEDGAQDLEPGPDEARLLLCLSLSLVRLRSRVSRVDGAPPRGRLPLHFAPPSWRAFMTGLLRTRLRARLSRAAESTARITGVLPLSGPSSRRRRRGEQRIPLRNTKNTRLRNLDLATLALRTPRRAKYIIESPANSPPVAHE